MAIWLVRPHFPATLEQSPLVYSKADTLCGCHTGWWCLGALHGAIVPIARPTALGICTFEVKPNASMTTALKELDFDRIQLACFDCSSGLLHPEAMKTVVVENVLIVEVESAAIIGSKTEPVLAALVNSPFGCPAAGEIVTLPPARPCTSCISGVDAIDIPSVLHVGKVGHAVESHTISPWMTIGLLLDKARFRHLLFHWFWCWCTSTTMVSSIVLIVTSRLAIVRPGVVVTVPIVESQGVWTGWVGIDIQKAVCVIVTIRFAVEGAAQPPRAFVGGPPSSLLWS